MATLAQLAAAAASLVEDAEVQHAIVHGPASGEGSTVTTDGGDVPTHAKQAADFQVAIDALTGAGLDAVLNLLGVVKRPDLATANTDFGVGVIFFNQATGKLENTTA